MSEKRPNRHNLGVTIVEILVVALIISVLVVLIFPTLQGVLETSRRTRCAGNLRQIGLAWQLKVAENNQRIPKIANNWFLWGGFDTGTLSPIDAPSIASRVFTPDKEPSLSKEIFKCPSDQLNRAFLNPVSTWKRMGTSYTPNPYVWYDVSVSPIIRTTFEIVDPWRTILLGDATIHLPAYQGIHPGADGRFTWHTKPGGGFKNNILFCDGHVGFVETKAQSTGGSSPDYKWVATADQ